MTDLAVLAEGMSAADGAQGGQPARDEPPSGAGEHRSRLQAETSVTPGGEFEILAITAGVGNGWRFGAEVLRASLAMWDGAECFVDHAGQGLGAGAGENPGGKSIRDLAGLLYAPAWDAPRQGIRCRLKAVGPAAGLLTELGRAVLSGGGPKPRVGFSADIVFTANGREVKSILRVLSVDLVYSPARGGEFVRSLNARKEWITMGEEVTTDQAQLQSDLEAARRLLAVQQEKEKVSAEVEAARQVRQAMCAYLLDSGLAASKLPAAMAEHVRRQFSGRVFEAGELDQAIGGARELVTQLTGALTVQGPGARAAGGRVHGMFDSQDQVQAAVYDLFGAERDAGTEGLQVARLSGIRELYLMLTGDIDLHGGYDPARVQLATTADFTGLVKNAMNKLVINSWDKVGAAGYDWWKKISVQEHFENLNQVTGILVGTVGDLPVVAEGAEYTELAIGDSPEVGTFYKYGGYVPLTLELIDRDNTRKLAAYARELGNAGMRKISSLVAAIFTANSGVGPTMADGGALFNATAVSSAGGHANLLTAALSAGQWDTVGAAMFSQPALVKNASGFYGTGPKIGINPRYCLVPRALMLTARQVLYPTLERSANIFSQNQQQGQPGDVVVVPEWTDANDWAAVIDPVLMPGIYVGERFGITPQVFAAGDNLSPAVFMNDESRLKVRHFLAVWVNDFRPLHKENV